MNRMIRTLVILSVLAAIPLAGWAEETKGIHEGKMGMMMGRDGKCPEHAMMMGKMMERSMIPTNDGGVIILIGNKLIKFDKDLNMVKKAMVDLDIPGIQKMIKDMTDKCPMCQKMMGEGQMK